VLKNIHTRVLIAMLFIKKKTQKEPKYIKIGDALNNGIGYILSTWGDIP
jgi:hypothetical protein